MALDILIKNGTIIDGVGTPAFHADVAVKNGKIERIGFLGNPSAETVIDAAGCHVAPGFIDINNASDRHWTLFSHPDLESYLYQGVTTVIGGNCGSSLAPLTTGNVIAAIQKWADIKQINVNWLSLSEFFDEVRKKKFLLNFGTLIGHATLRRSIVKDEFRDLTDGELSQAKHLLETALSQGAMGFSTGLGYSHAKMASAEEIATLVSTLSAKGGSAFGGKQEKIYSAHLRDEGSKLYESVVEAIEVSKKTKANLEISHFKAVGQNNWPIFKKGLEEIHKAAAEGLNVNFDVYPYTSTATVFYTLLPDFVAVGGRMKLLENLKNPELKKRVVEEMGDREGEFRNIIIASGDIDKTFIGKTLEFIAKNQGTGILETMINLLLAAEGKLIVFWPSLSEENLTEALKSNLSIIASDGAAFNLEDSKSGYLSHPRSFGCFTRILSHYVREKNILSFEEAIKKMTALPALKIGLKHRGIIKDGYFADIAIFNPETVKDMATFDNPFQYSRGIHSVIINGQLALSEGKIQNHGLGELL
ncbi:hypothetical protein A2567_00935 [Candidatus Azambacteria bacterium RIFOXYD1_FULL_42_11]|uniref:N-acyl-D-amino-acid deacylase n=3 Tax=Candidatus Azamiibacteriota TaxID=1752741 RepID=A0A0G0ZD56_9BACT|nr:MAG: N-acyl-D-amino-acid deacylase [Candidatus Azambacteria bacterium GW2011_GWA1_42_19]KKS75827.1 MAG: N-acyl-D-amino-acid deacylase [Candidatus Azambacteria bacterium GW2011_GWA2_42_9]KKS88938.1 MAG: N-acyl-D-amino-acid deacylase [Parcubacteria group bacterium GW2011_GWC1_43_11]OGD41787.1 MAG: hypothetical protein A2567_00935 [Candidatus Azambacteria bacterium RIFOXYD1_FULL_42_11]